MNEAWGECGLAAGCRWQWPLSRAFRTGFDRLQGERNLFAESETSHYWGVGEPPLSLYADHTTNGQARCTVGP